MEILRGDIFKTKCETIVEVVNTLGIISGGTGWQYKRRYPQSYTVYMKSFKEKNVQIGNLYFSKTLEIDPDTKLSHNILKFPIKHKLIQKADIKDIELGLKKFVDKYKVLGINSIAFPLLGDDPNKIKECQELMEKYLNSVDIPLEVYIS